MLLQVQLIVTLSNWIFGPKFLSVNAEIIQNVDPEFQGRPLQASPKLQEFQTLYDDLFDPDSTTRRKPASDSVIRNLPDLSNITALCPKEALFAYFNPIHMRSVNELVNIFLKYKSNTKELLEVAQAIKNNPNINTHLWFYALTIVGVKSSDLQLIRKVQPYQAMPDLFVPTQIIQEAESRKRQKENRVVKRQSSDCNELDEKVGADNGDENRLWYFRESIPVNSHHWYYHQMYPHGVSTGKREDRRGELFYYFHASILARYNTERLANGLSFVKGLPIWEDSKLIAYNPHLKDLTSGKSWSERKEGAKLVSVNIGQNLIVDIYNHLHYPISRLLKAVNVTYAIAKNNAKVSLRGINGIDILGDLIQCHFFYSINPSFYNGEKGGYGFHNTGHALISFASDPDGTLKLPVGPLGDPATSMRDPIFYEWHVTVQNLFEKHKKTLHPYHPKTGELQLLWPGVEISNIRLESSGKENQLETFWKIRNLNLNRGIDLIMKQSGEISLCAKELNHDRFTYHFTINKDQSVQTTKATVRIYMAPRFNAQGERFSMIEQRSLFFVLDVFMITLKFGSNDFIRHSNASLLTIPVERGIENINEHNDAQTPYCGCGWPENLLIPKGTAQGMKFDLFMMVTNGDDDHVKQNSRGPHYGDDCIPRPIYCGRVNQKYPDAKPMGYPFDRFPHSVDGAAVKNLDEYIQGISNIGTIIIKFTDIVKEN